MSVTSAASPARVVQVGDLEFGYDDRVLTPRPWTQAQSSWARDLLRSLPQGPVLELCSGAGHIGALSLLGNDRCLVMVDANPVACEFARSNVRAAGLEDRVEVRNERLEDALHDEESFPLVVADPPWVPSAEVGRYPEDPVDAIDGGADGLGPTRACLEVVGRHLDDEGRCVLQVGTTVQVHAVRGLLRERPELRLQVAEMRVFSRGVLVLLRRPDRGTTC